MELAQCIAHHAVARGDGLVESNHPTGSNSLPAIKNTKLRPTAGAVSHVAQKVGCKSRTLRKQEAVRVFLCTVCNQIIALTTKRFFAL
jgi:hypothetical protein